MTENLEDQTKRTMDGIKQVATLLPRTVKWRSMARRSLATEERTS